MKINENIQIELDKNVSDYFVITKSISDKMTSIQELEKQHLENKLSNKVDKELLNALKKDTYLYQFYNVFLVKTISNIRLLYKIIQTNKELTLESSVIDQDTFETTIQNIIESDPEALVVENQEIVIIDETLKDIFENKLDISEDELKNIMNKNEEG